MKKEDLQTIKSLLKTPRGKAIAFFAIYFIFFLIIAIVSRTSNGKEGPVYEVGSPIQIDILSIENNNYKFSYIVEIDGNYVSYIGTKNDEKELLTYNNSQFYGETGNYFTNANGVWIKADNPYLYSEFYKTSNLSYFINSATYLSKTEYESGKVIYNFSLSSATINKLLENIDLDVEEIPNEIIVSVDENNYITEIKFKLESYCKIKGICLNNMNVTLNYEMHGQIEEIVSPLR